MFTSTERIKPDAQSIALYLENLLSNKYQIPTFQRNVVWEKENVKKLWDSIYKFYPLGSILIWKTNTKLESHREIGGLKFADNFHSNEYQYILDGQQRTTSLLTSIHGGNIANNENFNPTLYIDLTIELTDATDDISYAKRFLFWDEIDDRDGQLKANTGRKKRYQDKLIVRVIDIIKDYGKIENNIYVSVNGEYDHPYMQQLRRIREVGRPHHVNKTSLFSIDSKIISLIPTY
ncbi:DUF262 domain-containing protein [Nostoc sp.]|uniref:DUF262 domain-containing protein n=1 Tax=Nostoc sp. TaxID=1180 RepID=UPI002FF53A50